MCRCMKAMVEFEACEGLWAAMGDALAAQLAITRLIEHFSAAAAAVHCSYLTYRPLPPPGFGSTVGVEASYVGINPDLLSGGGGWAFDGGPNSGGSGGGGGSTGQHYLTQPAGTAHRYGETYLELCTSVEVFMEVGRGLQGGGLGIRVHYRRKESCWGFMCTSPTE